MTRRHVRLVNHIVAWVAVAIAAWLITPNAPALDDAYIALASARAVVRGFDPNYGVPALTGATSPAYVALLVFLLKIGVESLGAVRLATALGLTAFVAALWALATNAGLIDWRRPVFVLTAVTAGHTLTVATNGLETGWALATLTAMIAAHIARRPVLVAVAAGVLAFLRPDLAVAGAFVFALTMWRRSWRESAFLAALAAAVALPFALWVRLDTGMWLPQTMAAKTYFFAEGCAPLSSRLTRAAAPVGVWLLLTFPVSLGVFALTRDTLGRVGLLALGLTLTGYVVSLPGGLWHNIQRYLYAMALPWVALGATRLCRARGERGLLIALVAYNALLFPARFPNQAAAAEELRGAAVWIEDTLPHDRPVLVHDAGAASVWTTHRLVDLVGLKSPASIDVHRRWTWASCGAMRVEAVATIAQSSGTGYLVMTDEWERLFGIARGLSRLGFRLTVLRTKPVHLNHGYTVYRLESSNARVPDPPLAVRVP